MQVPEVPLQIDREAWIDALEAVSIPVRGHHLMRIEADWSGVTVTYKRRTEDGLAIVGMDRELATVQIGLSLTPINRGGGILPSPNWAIVGEHGPELVKPDKGGE